MIDLRTKKEKETEQRKQTIFALFDQIDEQSGFEFSTWRICVCIAQKVGCTPHNVYAYCVRANKRSYADKHRYDKIRDRLNK